MRSQFSGVSRVAMTAALGFLGLADAALADDAAPSADIIVTGTRLTGAKAADSAAPIEIIGSDTLKRTGLSDLPAALATTVPSLTIQSNGGDMAGLSIQAALRGVSPNDTLVMIDGKRRHGSSNLSVDGGSTYSGSAATDLSFIPIGSIDHVEVLTDGAAAQYGTDAVAGVVNVILKKNSDGGSLSLTGGQYYTGQGVQGAWAVNKGFSLGGKGFLNVTLEEKYHDETILGWGDKRYNTVDGGFIPQSYPNSNIPKSANYPYTNAVNGDPKSNLYSLFYNAGYELGDGLEVYSFGSYGWRVAQHFENYRLPNKVAGTAIGGAKIYPIPYGFDPSEQNREADYSFTAGLKGVALGWKWDLSSTYGGDDNQIYVVDSGNSQLFAAQQALSATPLTAQRTFHNGAFAGSQWTNNLDLDKSFDVGLASSLNVALGAETRHETYTVTAGEPASYYGAGAQSFDGYTPLDSGSHSRDNYGVYADVAVDPIKGLHTDLAARYEHYSDFGDTSIGKFTGRYDFSPAFALRGTVSTGFRAPTLAEEYYSGTNVSPSSAEVQLPANSAAAAVAGFSSLKPEKSTNYSLGFVAHPLPKLQITMDVYEIDIRDRILVSGFIYGTNTVGGKIVTISPTVLNSIAARGVTLDSGLSYTGIAVFANAANTKTQGAEITANYASDFGEYGHVDWTALGNINQNAITKSLALPSGDQNAKYGQVNFLDPHAATALTTATPRAKLVLQGLWSVEKWQVTLRETVYGPTAQWTGNDAYYAKIGTTGITDLDVGYKVIPSVKLSIGANNLFNKIPPLTPNNASNVPVGGGRVFNVPLGFAPWNSNGGYYYARAVWSF